MAFITEATRKDAIALVVTTLGTAPSAKLMADINEKLVGGATLGDIAAHLTSSAAYLAKYPAGQTAEEVASDILDAALVGGTVADDARAEAMDLLTAGLTSGQYTIASATKAVADYLSGSAPAAAFADAAAAFQNRVDAAEDFTKTFTLEGVAATAAELAAALDGVTSDADTLASAKAAFAAGSKSIAEQAVVDAAAEKAAADKAAADKAAEEKAAADKAAEEKAAADKAAEEKAAADAEQALVDAATEAATAAATAIEAAEAADAALATAKTASEAAATKAALTDATALTAATTAATTADTAAKAAVVTATAAYEAALTAGVAADVSTANGALLIAQNNASVAAEALATAKTASDAATADDAAAATAATAYETALEAANTAGAAAETAAAAAATAAAATENTDDDTAAAAQVTEAAAATTTADAIATAAAEEAAAAKAAEEKAAADAAAAKAAEEKAAADKAAADKAAADKAIADAAAAEAGKKTIALTTGIDTKDGGDYDDTFTALANTYSNGDVLDGGKGTDTIAITDNVAGMAIAAPSTTVSNIENLTITTNGSVGVAGVTGVTAVAAGKEVDTWSMSADVADIITVVYNGITLATPPIAGAAGGAGDIEAASEVAALLNAAAGTTIASAINANVIVTAPVAGTALPTYTVTNGDQSGTGAVSTKVESIANVAAVAAVTAVTAAPYDVSGIASLEDVQVTSTAAIDLKVSDTADVTATTTAGKVTLVNGLSQTVTAKGGFNVTSGVGAISVTDTAQAAVNSVVSGGTSVDITTSGLTTGTLTVGGATTAASGAVNVTSTGAAYAAATAVTLGAIGVTGGTSVTVGQTATSSTAKAAADGAAANRTQSDVTVTGNAATTEVTVTQDAAVTAVNARAAVAAVTGTQTLTFAGLGAGDTATLTLDAGDTIVFTAAKALTALQVAQAFANLAKGDTSGSAPASNGAYTSGGTIDQGWYTGDATAGATAASATVKIFNAAAVNGGAIADVALIDSNGGASDSARTDAVVAVTARAGKMGVVGGAAVVNGAITGADVLETVTLDGYGAATTIASDAIATINLSNSAQGVAVTTGSIGGVTLNLDKITGGAALNLDTGAATVTGVTINTTGTASVVDVIADAALAVTVNAGVKTTLTGSSFNAAKTITITGSGAVVLDEDGAYNAVTSIVASGNSGGVNATARTLPAAATFTGGTGADSVTLGTSTKSITMGDGDDTVTMTGNLGATGSIAGGDGIDTLKMTVASAQNYDAFAQTIHTGFERVTFTDKLGTADGVDDSAAIDMTFLGASTYVTVAGSQVNGVGGATATDVLTLNKMSDGATVAIAGQGDVVVSITGAALSAANSLNIAMSSNAATVGGTLTAASVETINLSVNDVFVDANLDGLDDANAADTLTLVATSATSVTVTGSADLVLTNSGNTAIQTINASSMTGKLTVVSANTATASSITGGSGADTLTGAGVSDTINGGAGNDILTAGGTLGTLIGGAGNDTFVVDTATNKNTYATISDLSSGDIIDTLAAVFDPTAISLAGTASFLDYVTAAIVEAGADEAVYFQYSGDTYLVVDEVGADGAVFADGTDQIIKITGLVNLGSASFDTTTGDLTII